MKNNSRVLAGRASQRGVSVLGILVALILLGGLLTVGATLVPIYVDDLTIQEVVEGLENQKSVTDKTQAQIRRIISDGLNRNGVRDFDPKTIAVRQEGGRLHIAIEYEVRENLFSNIDAVVHFDHKFEIAGQ
ncbi:DUF4845 domain-containing protein [Marinobacter sp.]|uniref:DUF4845 domain-containing protein n=1 Tax=Marinobacter sp. TaxID=50741 RepID=UPI00384ACC70